MRSWFRLLNTYIVQPFAFRLMIPLVLLFCLVVAMPARLSFDTLRFVAWAFYALVTNDDDEVTRTHNLLRKAWTTALQDGLEFIDVCFYTALHGRFPW